MLKSVFGLMALFCGWWMSGGFFGCPEMSYEMPKICFLKPQNNSQKTSKIYHNLPKIVTHFHHTWRHRKKSHKPIQSVPYQSSSPSKTIQVIYKNDQASPSSIYKKFKKNLTENYRNNRNLKIKIQLVHCFWPHV
jgi:hypothetical protein